MRCKHENCGKLAIGPLQLCRVHGQLAQSSMGAGGALSSQKNRASADSEDGEENETGFDFDLGEVDVCNTCLPLMGNPPVLGRRSVEEFNFLNEDSAGASASATRDWSGSPSDGKSSKRQKSIEKAPT